MDTTTNAPTYTPPQPAAVVRVTNRNGIDRGEFPIWGVGDIRRAMDAAGSHWWDADSMRFFGSRVHSTLYHGPGGIYFVTSEEPPHGPRMYSVRQFHPETVDIDTVGKIPTRAVAHRMARDAAAGKRRTLYGTVTVDQYGGTTLEATADQLSQWSHKPGGQWPCSTLKAAGAGWAHLDTRGDLVDLSDSWRDVDGPEFDAWKDDILAAPAA